MLLLLCRHQRSACETNWIGCDEKSGFKIGSENDGSTFQGEWRNENVLRTSSPPLPSSFSWLIFMKDWAGGRTSLSVGRSANCWLARARRRGAKIGCHLHNISKLYSAPQNQPSFLPDDGRRRTAIIHTQLTRFVALQGDWRGAAEPAQVECRIYASSKKKRQNK